MANQGYVYQQSHTVSIPREGLIKVAKSSILNLDDYRVLIMLFTQLDGYYCTYDSLNNNKYHDPKNFKKIDVEQIAKTLDMKKKDVKKSIHRLYDLYLIDSGDSDTVSDGYRFTF